MALSHKNAVNEYLVQTEGKETFAGNWHNWFHGKKPEPGEEPSSVANKSEQDPPAQQSENEVTTLKAQIKTLQEDIHILENRVHVQKVDDYFNAVPGGLEAKKIFMNKLEDYQRQKFLANPEKLLEDWTYLSAPADREKFHSMVTSLNAYLEKDEDMYKSEKIVNLLPYFTSRWFKKAGM